MVNRPASEKGLPTVRIGDRYITAFDPIKALDVVEKIAEGGLLKEVLDLPGMPSQSTWYRWMVLYPDLKEAYNTARIISAQGMEERLLELCEELLETDVKSSMKLDQIKLAMAQLRWSAARRDPSSYGEKSNQSTVIPIQINTSLPMEPGATQETKTSMYEISVQRPASSEMGEEGEESEVEEPSFTAPISPMVRKGKHKTPAQTRATIKAREKAKAKKNGTAKRTGRD